MQRFAIVVFASVVIVVAIIWAPGAPSVGPVVGAIPSLYAEDVNGEHRLSRIPDKPSDLIVRGVVMHAEHSIEFRTRKCELHVSRGRKHATFVFDGYPDESSYSLLGPDTCPALDAREGHDRIVITRRDGLPLFAFSVSELAPVWSPR